MDRIRIGVVGAGYMGTNFARLIQAHPLCELAGIADLNPEVAARASESLCCSAFDSAEALLDRQVDGLVVATVEDQHVGPCLAAFAQGAGVLVEKPLATTVADAEAIIAASVAADRPLLVGHVLRFDARYARLRQEVAAGTIGDPLTIFARRLNGIGAQNRLRGRCSLPLFLGVHDYDMVRWVAGSEVTEVVARDAAVSWPALATPSRTPVSPC